MARKKGIESGLGTSPYDEPTQQIHRNQTDRLPNAIIDGQVVYDDQADLQYTSDISTQETDSNPHSTEQTNTSPTDRLPSAIIDGNLVYDSQTDTPDLSTTDTDTDTSTNPDPTSPYHDRTDSLFQNAESRFNSSRNGQRVQLIDPAVVEHARVARMEFTSQEIANEINTSAYDNPLLLQLQQARLALDEKSEPLAKFTNRLMMNGPERRKLKHEQALAQRRFEIRRDNYIASKESVIDPTNPLTALTIARAHLAEATYAARQGSVKGADRHSQNNLREARDAYNAAQDAYFEELTRNYPDLTLEEGVQFTSSLRDHERGALAGEEANMYLTEVNDDDKKSFFRKGLERFNKLSRTQKVVSGIAVAALAGIGFGAIGGAAAIGGTLGVKFARSVINGEADRINAHASVRAQQEQSVLYAGNFDQSQQEHQAIQDIRNGSEDDFYRTYNNAYTQYNRDHRTAVIEESERITKEKRRVYGKAALFLAIPFVGGAVVGAIAENAVHNLSHGVFREHGLFGEHNQSNDTPQTQPEAETPGTTEADTPPSADGTPTESDDSTTHDTQPDPESEPQPTAENAALFGDYAGKNITVTIPEGSSVWEQISDTIASQHPLTSYAERERLVGNILEHIQHSNPGKNLNIIPAGTLISTDIPL